MREAYSEVDSVFVIDIVGGDGYKGADEHVDTHAHDNQVFIDLEDD